MTATDKKQNLLLLFDRPQEPVFIPKGPKKSSFNVPQSYLADRYKPIGVELFNRFGEDASEKIPVKEIALPNLGEILDLGRHENFSLFLPKHRRLAGRLIDIFLGMRNVDELQSIAVFSRDRVNPYLFNYALSVAILHRKDTQDLDLPSFIQSFPDKYVDSKVFTRAREEATIVPDGNREPIEIPRDYTASNLETEHRLAYFREDLGINLHHWHWHLVYPFEGSPTVVNKNRRGELFYYMHQQIIARYNFERLSNKLKRVERWTDWKAPIEEAYFPKLDSLVASRAWPARVARQTISNLNREVDQIQQDVDDLIRWRDRIYAAIHSGFVTNESGQQIPLTENEGIDILGNIMESSNLSPNRTFYGDMHNMGHVFISYIHDPDHRHLESFGVMGDSATAMRDPIFYRWHAYIDDMFQEYKATLPRYNEENLNYPGVTVDKIEVMVQGGKPNMLNTFWQQSDVDLSRGMDFQPRGPVFARFTHLQHQPFTYNITVNNQAGAGKMGTCRVFLAPKFDERGNPWLFRDQKNLFIELDKFVVTLRQGMNTITRTSDLSSVTIPFERTFRNLDNSRPTGGEALAQFNFCGCGWPAHMLLPMGSPEGFQCQLFVMISNYELDRVNQTTEGVCNDSASYCGIKDKLYPDRRSMGYPFDRMPRPRVDTLQQFLTTNMRVQDCIIKFTDRVVQRPAART
ncbi:PREDICTED: phenoloxidase 2-like [Nicrophorus vespilloides]|uniref:Phenoloxidase 2-like n=1 Tax=Nicrophorus vespilloides TaxID=110193 RepID=A0ABM1MMW1_NICVS|nr:PREDICTED: phenoloxidase 2-like [Nicrophorus vespilloides]